MAPVPAAARAKQAEGAKRIVAVRISDPPTPSQEPLGGLTLDDLRQFFSGSGSIERISCAPFPRKGPVLLIDALIQYEEPATAVAAVAAYHGASMTGGPSCSLALALFQAEEVPIDRRDPLSWDIAGAPAHQPPVYGSWLGASNDGTGGHGDSVSQYGTPAFDARVGDGSGRRVVLAHITSLARPDLLPLGGLSLDTMHAVFSQCGFVEKIACTAMPKAGTPLQFIDAMVQFETEAQAGDAVQTFDGISLSSDNHNFAQMKFSKHSELRTIGNSERTRVYIAGATPNGDLATPVAMAPGPKRLHGASGAGPATKRPRLEGFSGTSPVGSDAASVAVSLGNESRRVILAHITELASPQMRPLGGLSVDTVHTAFSPFGSVEKVVCVFFPRTGPPLDWVDAMVQFRSPAEAVAAMQTLEGVSLTGDGFNRVQCKWSKHQELTKQGESDVHKDYTSGGGGAPRVATPTHLAALSVATPLAPVAALPVGAARDARGLRGTTTELATSATPVLAVFNLAEEMADPDILFNLFSLYGYVEIVKVVFKRPRDTALVQFTEPGFVDLAVECLHGSSLLGRVLDVRRSKQSSIRCTEKDLNSAERTTRSYTMLEQFWTKKDYQRIWDNAAHPSRTLFVKNIAPQLGEQELLPLFRQHGPVTDFAFLPCRPPARFKTAVVQMADIADAMAAVCIVQQERFPRLDEGGQDMMRLMVSFSKKDEMPKNIVREGVPVA